MQALFRAAARTLTAGGASFSLMGRRRLAPVLQAPRAPMFAFRLRRVSSSASNGSGGGSGSKPANETMVLTVEIVGARELMNMDVMGFSDPFCVLRMDGATGERKEMRTSIVENDLNPIWGETFDFHVPKSFGDGGSPLHINVFDFDGLKPPDVLGVVELPAAAILRGLDKARSKGQKQWETFFWLGPDPELQRRGRLYVNFSMRTWDEFLQLRERRQHQADTSGLLGTIAPDPFPVADRPPAISTKPDFWSTACTHVDPKKRKYRILSLDGGGVRGVLSAAVLHRLVLAYPRLLESVDLIAGTSTGGILALIFAAGYTPAQAQQIYEVYCPPIFSSTPVRRYSLFSSKYTEAAKYEAFNRYLTGVTLGSLAKHVLIASFRMDGTNTSVRQSFFGDVKSWRPALFSNVPKAAGPVEPDTDLAAIDVAMMTSAAPTYFPPYRIGGTGSVYVDGGVFANNPSQMAVAKVQAHYPSLALDNVSVLSLGAGCFNFNLTFEPTDSTDWGVRQWAPHVMNLLLDSGRLANDYTLGMMLKRRYFRLDPNLPRNFPLDSVEDIPELVSIGKAVDLSAAMQFIETEWFGDEHSAREGLDVRDAAADSCKV